MTDQTLRELERRWQASQSVEDETALLRKRLQLGLLQERHLVLAAFLGHEASARLVESPLVFEFEEDEVPSLDWIGKLEGFDAEVHVRIALAAAYLGEAGLVYAYDFDADTVRFEWPAAGLVVDDIEDPALAETVSDCQTGDKLGGWPLWIQSADYPKCSQCERPMDFVFQLVSEENVPFMFGDCGVGRIFRCVEHRHVVAFNWDCS